jgi:F0F1-type ATP synthase assembly protein I
MAVDIVFRLGVSVVAGLAFGFLVDGWLRTSPVFTLIGLGLGVAAAGYTIWDVSKRYTGS